MDKNLWKFRNEVSRIAVEKGIVYNNPDDTQKQSNVFFFDFLTRKMQEFVKDILDKKYTPEQFLDTIWKDLTIKKCDNCEKEVDITQPHPMLVYSYRTFYFCSDECADEYVQ